MRDSNKAIIGRFYSTRMDVFCMAGFASWLLMPLPFCLLALILEDTAGNLDGILSFLQFYFATGLVGSILFLPIMALVLPASYFLSRRLDYQEWPVFLFIGGLIGLLADIFLQLAGEAPIMFLGFSIANGIWCALIYYRTLVLLNRLGASPARPTEPPHPHRTETFPD